MFGKLSLEAIPFHDPIIMGTMVVVILGAPPCWGRSLTSVSGNTCGPNGLPRSITRRSASCSIIVALVMLLRGFADAIMMRTQQAVASADSAGFLPPHHYDQIFTAHGVIMIFFMAMPFITGLMNIVVPLQIGARDVAYPFLNSLSFWLFMVGVVLLMLSLFVGEFAATGWLAYPPLSGLDYSPGVGVDYYLWALQLSGLGTTLSGINFIVTIMKMRAPGMALMKMPVFTWTALVTNILIVAAFPVLAATLALLTLDRYLDMHFFTNDLGGNVMMYVNLIWIWGHPEVYILVLPCFGVFSEIVATYSKKTLFGYKSMVYATASIGVLSFLVWLHHFFTMGAGANVNAFFGIMTMIISIPTGAKVFNWLFTMYRGRVEFSLPMLWTIGFMIIFVIGGMTGVLMAIPAVSFVLHNSLFLVAHFHNTIIGGVVFGCIAGMVYWFPKAFGFKLNERLGRYSFWCWFVGFFLTFTPMYLLGFKGMTRRLNTYDNPEWQPYLLVALVGATLIMLGIFFLLQQVFVSIRDRKENMDVTGDPWGGRTLEWSTSSPPPFYNFAHVPHIDSLDQFWEDKENGRAYQRPAKYEDVHMPRNTAAGIYIGAFGLAMSFGLIWHMWWLAIVGFLGMIVSFVVRSYDRDVDYYVPAKEVEEIENAYFGKLQQKAA